MDKKKLIAVTALTLAFGGVLLLKGQSFSQNKTEQADNNHKTNKILYFSPEVYPNVEEIKPPTNIAFFSAVSDKVSSQKNNELLRVETPLEFENIDAETIKEYCQNNDADFAVIPMVKYFKVGFGQFIFSNQVVVSMKLYDKEGNFVSESSYNTYKRNMRMLGSTENSIKIGTLGAMKDLTKNLKKDTKNKKDTH